MIELLAFPGEALQQAWGWLNEMPRWNFDDDGPRTFDAFAEEMAARASSETEYLWAVRQNGELVGMIGVSRPVRRLARFHGICFTKSVHGTGVAKEAVETVMNGMFSDGVERFEAWYFNDNGRVRRFLKHLGFCDEGLLRNRTVRGGRPIDVRVVARLATVGAVVPCETAQMVGVN